MAYLNITQLRALHYQPLNQIYNGPLPYEQRKQSRKLSTEGLQTVRRTDGRTDGVEQLLEILLFVCDTGENIVSCIKYIIVIYYIQIILSDISACVISKDIKTSIKKSQLF